MDHPHRQELCKVCGQINFERYFTHRVNCYVTEHKQIGADVNAAKLGHLKDIHNRSSSCPFCWLVVMSICRKDASSSVSPDQRVKRDADGDERMECWIYSYCFAKYDLEESGPETAFRIGIAARQSKDILPNAADLVGSIQLLAEDAPQINRQKLFHGRIVDVKKVDMSLASNWLRICESEHKNKCEQLGPVYHGRDVRLCDLILVDVKNLCIFQQRSELPATPRFICLSYCWPPKKPFTLTQANLCEMLQEKSIQSKLEFLPDAIRDAIQCVADLGETYLWVDSLCIIQDDEENKRRQISQMAEIYTSALLTLVSVSSDLEYSDPQRNGLPRYRENTGGVQQHIEKVGNLRLAVPFDTFINRLDSSRWMTRAWTYQEQLLSKRLLYFTETQIYFQCSCSVFCEDSIGEGNPVSAYIFPGSNLWNMGAPYPSTTAYFGSFHLKWKQYEHLEDAINDYAYHVERYAARNMSDKSDILLAFKGIEAVMSHSMTSEFYYGLPVSGLDSALLWTLVGAHKRRKVIVKGSKKISFPSWTWAGWDSKVELCSYFFTTGIQREINWYLINADGTAIFMQTEGDAVELVSDEFEGMVGPIGPSPTHFFNKEQLLSSSLVDAHEQDRKDSMSLACWTTVAAFYLTGDEQSLGDHGNIWKHGTHLKIFNHNQEWAGCIMLGIEWVTSYVLTPCRFDFMLMSRSKAIKSELLNGSRPEYFDEKKYDNREWCLLNVMLIERVGNIAKRIGVGFIHEDAWVDSGPLSIFLKLE